MPSDKRSNANCTLLLPSYNLTPKEAHVYGHFFIIEKDMIALLSITQGHEAKVKNQVFVYSSHGKESMFIETLTSLDL